MPLDDAQRWQIWQRRPYGLQASIRTIVKENDNFVSRTGLPR
jgi:hypothetical protein